MNRYAWILLRAYLPATVLLLVAIGTMLWISVAGNVDMLSGWVSFLRWLPPVALLAALVAAAVATLRMWRWQRGDAPTCAACKGPLGRLHHGRAGDYRTCVACGARQDEPANPRQ